MLDSIIVFFKSLGLLKTFFLIVFPLALVGATLASLFEGNLAYDYQGYLIFALCLYGAIGGVIWLTRNVK